MEYIRTGVYVVEKACGVAVRVIDIVLDDIVVVECCYCCLSRLSLCLLIRGCLRSRDLGCLVCFETVVWWL